MKMLTYGALVFAGGAALLAGTFETARTTPVADRASACRFVGSEKERRRAEELDAKRLLTSRRLEVKWEATGALIRGEITLREAARRFREATLCDPSAERHLRRLYPNASELELYCRNVLGFVEGELMDLPEQQLAAILAVHQAEMERILQEEACCPSDEGL